MLHPSYTELMEKINSEEARGEEPAINSRYSIVIASSKRARELIAGAKPLSIAVKELYDSKIKILQDEEELDFNDELDFEEDFGDEEEFLEETEE